MTDWAATERAALLALLAELGPDAPTLLPGWTTHDLAAHLVVRERRPFVAPGLFVSVLNPPVAALERRMRRRPYEQLLDDLRNGPPPWSPGGALGGRLSEITDLHEFFVHHEDVRRVTDRQPRAIDAGAQDALWSRVRLLGPALATRATGVSVTAETPDGRSVRLRAIGEPVLLQGPPGELLLWLFGRRDVARVEVIGSDTARERAATAPLGW